jgi:hypothetical protein
MAKDSSLDFSLLLNPEIKKISKSPLAMGANPGRHSIICPTVLKVAVMILSHTSYLLSREYIEYVYISREREEKQGTLGSILGSPFHILPSIILSCSPPLLFHFSGDKRRILRI